MKSDWNAVPAGRQGRPSHRDEVCREEPMRLILDGRSYATFMCTPDDFEDMARGHLVTAGVVSRLDEIISIDIEYEPLSVVVETNCPEHTSRYKIKDVLSSSCGDGTAVSRDFLNKVGRVESSRTVDTQQLLEYMRRMFAAAVRKKETGGVHSAALFDSLGNEIVREDVGRHNAIDKVVGAALAVGINFNDCVLVTTGRIAGDMMLKSLSVGIPIVASRSIPSSFALAVADATNITVIGRVSRTPLVYSAAERFRSPQIDQEQSGGSGLQAG